MTTAEAREAVLYGPDQLAVTDALDAFESAVRAEERQRIMKALREARTGGLKTGHSRRPSGFSNAAAFVAALGEGLLDTLEAAAEQRGRREAVAAFIVKAIELEDFVHEGHVGGIAWHRERWRRLREWVYDLSVAVDLRREHMPKTAP